VPCEKLLLMTPEHRSKYKARAQTQGRCVDCWSRPVHSETTSSGFIYRSRLCVACLTKRRTRSRQAKLRSSRRTPQRPLTDRLYRCFMTSERGSRMRKQKLATWSVQARLDRPNGDRSQLCAAANLKNKWIYVIRERDPFKGRNGGGVRHSRTVRTRVHALCIASERTAYRHHGLDSLPLLSDSTPSIGSGANVSVESLRHGYCSPDDHLLTTWLMETEAGK
jgi:hypothetical protein